MEGDTSDTKSGRHHGPMAWPRRRLAPLLAVAVAVGATLGFGATPASAHGLTGPTPDDWVPRIDMMRPDVAGLDLRFVDLRRQVELTNRTGRTVTVLGYDGEPYLRFGADGGVEMNDRSPAATLNRSLDMSEPVPDDADPEAPPRWRTVSSGDRWRWHDHRTHWMGSDLPEIVAADRSRDHLIQTFSLGLQVGSDPVSVDGEVWWRAPSSPWPWVGLATLIALALAAAGATRRWPLALGSAVTAGTAAAIVGVVAGWRASTESVADTLAHEVYGIIAAGLGLATLVRLQRHGAFRAVPLALFTGAALALGIGAAGAGWLVHANLPTVLGIGAARATIAIALGTGVGALVVGLAHVAPPAKLTSPSETSG